MLYWLIRTIFYLPFKLLFPTKVIGKKNLLKDKSILICNHTSRLDAVILGININRQIHFLSKAELFKGKISTWFFSKMKAIPVNRGTADIKAIKQVLTTLKQNKIIGIFPQGTTIKENQEYKNGTALFAVKTNSPIVPMALKGKPKLFKRNVLIIGEPFYLTDETTRPTKNQLVSYTKKIENIQQNLLKNITKGENV